MMTQSLRDKAMLTASQGGEYISLRRTWHTSTVLQKGKITSFPFFSPRVRFAIFHCLSPLMMHAMFLTLAMCIRHITYRTCMNTMRAHILHTVGQWLN